MFVNIQLYLNIQLPNKAHEELKFQFSFGSAITHPWCISSKQHINESAKWENVDSNSYIAFPVHYTVLFRDDYF